MAIDILMPALSPTMETGTLASWNMGVGDAVRSGDVIAEIETDKATMEVEAVDDGVLAVILVAAGTENVAARRLPALPKMARLLTLSPPHLSPRLLRQRPRRWLKRRPIRRLRLRHLHLHRQLLCSHPLRPRAPRACSPARWPAASPVTMGWISPRCPAVARMAASCAVMSRRR